MGKKRREKTSIADAQRELVELAAGAQRIADRVLELGKQLDETLSDAQAQGLEPETLKTYVASWLLTTDDVPLSDLAQRLTKLARLRQEDVAAAWKDRFPVYLADAASQRLDGLRGAADAVRDAASDRNELQVAETLETLCREMEDEGPELDDLAARCRRYLAREA